MLAISRANAMGGNSGSVVGLPGCDIAGTSTDGIANATAAAKNADVIILAVGIDQSQEREGKDRTITTLPGVRDRGVPVAWDRGL